MLVEVGVILSSQSSCACFASALRHLLGVELLKQNYGRETMPEVEQQRLAVVRGAPDVVASEVKRKPTFCRLVLVVTECALYLVILGFLYLLRQTWSWLVVGSAAESHEQETMEKTVYYEILFSDRGYDDDDGTKITSQAECDSGVTDDQRSSAAEECDLEDADEDHNEEHKYSSSVEDTDSAQGSLLLESSESPNHLEKTFPSPLEEEEHEGDDSSGTESNNAGSLPKDSAVNVIVTPYKDNSVSSLNGNQNDETIKKPSSISVVSLNGQSSISDLSDRPVSPWRSNRELSSHQPFPSDNYQSNNDSNEIRKGLRSPSSKLADLIKNFENNINQSSPASQPVKSQPPRRKFVTNTFVQIAPVEEKVLPKSNGVVHNNKTTNGTEPVRVASPVSLKRLSHSPTRMAQERVLSPDVGSQEDLEVVGKDALSIGEVEENRRPRSATLSWDPTSLLKELYQLEFPQQYGTEGNIDYVNIEGYLETMPSNRKKATYWNPWKRRYFKVQDGFLTVYETRQSDKALLKAQLMGGTIDTLDNNMIGIDDRKGHYIAVKCSNEDESEVWLMALHSQCQENFVKSFVQPVMHPLRSHKDVIIIDLGSCSVRAGILMDQPTLPTVFFPTVCATDKNSCKKTFGAEALSPEVRRHCSLSFPLVPSAKITKYTMDVDSLPGLLQKVFKDLNVDPSKYKVQICVPRSFSLQTQVAVVKVLLEEFRVKALNLTHQAICSLYAYNTTSGIVVDIGDRLDIVPITDGYIVEGGVTRLPYGAQKIIHHLRHALAQKRISLFSDVDMYLVQYIQQQVCYIAENYMTELQRFHTDPDSIEKTVSVKEFFQKDCPYDAVSVDIGRFQAPEGLFTPDLWGLDSSGLHKLVHRAIQECSMDIRREMARSVYLSGGVTLTPGLPERLEIELDKLTPSAVTPKVHASPYREHMAYLGASTMASTSAFDEVCISLSEWRQQGNTCLSKWHL